MKTKSKLEKALDNSFINYFSDLFIVVMVVAWIAVILIIIPFAIYATIVIQDTSVWSYLVEIVSIPLSAGGTIWMIKNSIQHAIAYNKGKRAHMDFPKVEDAEIGEKEEAETEDDEAETVIEEEPEESTDYSETELKNMTLANLRGICQDIGLESEIEYSNMKKADIVSLILAYQKGEQR